MKTVKSLARAYRDKIARSPKNILKMIGMLVFTERWQYLNKNEVKFYCSDTSEIEIGLNDDLTLSWTTIRDWDCCLDWKGWRPNPKE